MDEPQPQPERLRATVASVRAPLGLRERIEADRTRLRPRRELRRRMQLTGGVMGAAALAGVVIGLIVPGGGQPGVFEAAALGARPPTAPAPARDASHPSLLRAHVDGVRFPAWRERFPWSASGLRRDSVSGRDVVTVFYDDPAGARLGYTIVAGESLPWPKDSRTVVREAVEIHVSSHAGRRVVTWRAAGHQCVISAPSSVPVDRLVTLAAASGADYR